MHSFSTRGDPLVGNTPAAVKPEGMASDWANLPDVSKTV
jgi:hypothetical protein